MKVDEHSFQSTPVAHVTLGYAAANVRQGIDDPTRPGLSSVLCGSLLFIPFITGALAIGLGWSAIRGDTFGAERAMGIAGFILGTFNCVGWAVLMILFSAFA